MSACKGAVPAAPRSPEHQQRRSWRRAVLLGTGCGLAAVNLARAPGDLAFVVPAHAVLALLFLCLGRFEEAPPPTPEARAPLRACVWALSAALTAMFTCRVAPAMPSPLNLLVYGMALLVTAGGFVLLVPLRICDAGDGDGGQGTWDDKVSQL
ncbi:hypothetical protein BS78_03G036900 [Paspalum vaginatum]|nr:hypothetical protein BS78_03G036900 [Paspalum vaginatum]